MPAARTSQVIAIDYRMPPARPFPAAVDDAVAVYRHVLGNRPARSIALGGTSAGGGLTLATVRQLIELGVDVPGAIYLGTPWADLTDTSDTLHTNEAIDRVLLNYDGWLSAAARLYAGDHELTHRLISPVYGEFDGFPPTYLISGTRDMPLSGIVKLRLTAVSDPQHGGFTAGSSPVSWGSIDELFVSLTVP